MTVDPYAQIFIQVVIAAFMGGGVYGAIRADLKNMNEKIEREIRERQDNDTEQFRELSQLRDGVVAPLRAEFNYLKGRFKGNNHNRDPEATDP